MEAEASIESEMEKRVSIALIGIRSIGHSVYSNLKDVYVTQTSNGQISVPIPEGGHHIIFYNSLTMRLPAVNRRLSAIVPRSVYNRIAAKLEGSRIGAIHTDGRLHFLCVEKSEKVNFKEWLVVKTVRNLVENIGNLPSLFYLSNGCKKWRIKTFVPVAEEVSSLENYIVSLNSDNFYENIDQCSSSRTKSGQERNIPPPPRGECWPSSIYNNLHNLRCINPSDTDSEAEKEGPKSYKTQEDFEKAVAEAVQKEVAAKLAALEKPNPTPTPDPQPGPSGARETYNPITETTDDGNVEPVTEEENHPHHSDPDPTAPSKGGASRPDQCEPDIESEGRKRDRSPSQEPKLKKSNAAQQTTLGRKGRIPREVANLQCPEIKERGFPGEEILDRLMTEMEVEETLLTSSSDNESIDESLASFVESEILYSGKPMKDHDCSPVVATPPQLALRTRCKVKAREEVKEKLQKTGQLFRLRKKK